jgi:hypothetical protein
MPCISDITDPTWVDVVASNDLCGHTASQSRSDILHLCVDSLSTQCVSALGSTWASDYFFHIRLVPTPQIHHIVGGTIHLIARHGCRGTIIMRLKPRVIQCCICKQFHIMISPVGRSYKGYQSCWYGYEAILEWQRKWITDSSQHHHHAKVLVYTVWNLRSFCFRRGYRYHT